MSQMLCNFIKVIVKDHRKLSISKVKDHRKLSISKLGTN